MPICHNEVRLSPRNLPRQRCLSNRLLIKPQPAAIQRRLDFFGNDVSFFTVEEGHQKLTVTALSKVQVEAAAPPEATATAPWDQVRDSLGCDRTPSGLDAYQHVFDSQQVKTSAELAAYALPLRAHVNLIPLNPTPGYLVRGSTADEVRRFRDRLADRGVNVTVRQTRGRSIDAACGQLAQVTNGRRRSVTLRPR